MTSIDFDACVAQRRIQKLTPCPVISGIGQVCGREMEEVRVYEGNRRFGKGVEKIGREKVIDWQEKMELIREQEVIDWYDW